ncbi:DUF505 domain-containing protein [Hippea alviniae]|uniref:DUF505 domain-containing protein n=1 Tax=Hippea alviniae TaxID=1279027 RepID=UPI0003B76C45|nr:DUF505 domain-containing protein [Hippea alviniae]
MVIKKNHAEMLLKLLKEKETDRHLTVLEKENDEVVRTLERAGLVSLDSRLNVSLTYAGVGIAQQLDALIEKGELKHFNQWDDDWKWIGSEIIEMLDSAEKSENITDITLPYLKERGFVEEDKLKKKFVLNKEAEFILHTYKATSPLLVVSAELAEEIRKLPFGPALSSRLHVGEYYESLLEAMRLIAYSVPKSDVYSFTALGQAVKNTLELGGFVKEGYVLSPHILINLAALADGEEIDNDAKSWLEALGYVNADGELSPAGEWALEVYRLWKKDARVDVWSFSIEDEEIAVLEVIDYLWKKNKENKEILPTFEQIKAELVDRKVKEYEKLIEKYGKKIKEMPEKFRRIAEQFQQTKNYIKWFEDNFNLRIALFSLESFNLIKTIEKDGHNEVFELSEFGKEVLKDQQVRRRSISSTAVKAITMTRKAFSAPSIEWYEKAKETSLVGTAEPTKSGYFYAYLAEEIKREPYLTKYEHEIFKMIPDKGMTVDELLGRAKNDDERRKMQWALEKLEARHLIEILPDNNIVETEAGQLMDRALSGVPTSFATPITPVMYRVIKALSEVGSLYEKEKKIRILPKKHKEAIKRSGLSEDLFKEAFNVCKRAGFVGVNTVNEAGLLILEATKLMNPQESLIGYADMYEYKKEHLSE